MPHPSLVRRHKGLLRHTLDQLLLIDVVRYAVVAARYVWFVHVRRRLATYQPSNHSTMAVAKNTIMHNLKGLRDLAVNRSHLLVRPLSVIETLPVDARILSVGPRTEGELFNLAAHGFSLERVTGLDLISYSPRVRLGDMHRLPFPNDEFHASVLGWVLAYSEQPELAAREVIRVTRPGGVVAVGIEYSPQSQEEIVRQIGYLPGARRRIGSTSEILALFGDAVDHVYFNHTVAERDRARVGAFCVAFSIKKGDLRHDVGR